MLRWFRVFLPKEERFFDLFARHADTVVKGAEALQGVLRGGEETAVYCQRVSQFENEDDAIDQMQQTAKAVMLFEVRQFEPPMREMGQLIVECADLVQKALPLLKAIGDNVSMLTAITEELGKL